MAKKGMTFNNQAAKSKWALLENAKDDAFEKIVAGKGSAGDFKKVSDTLDKMSDVAKTVFDEAVDAASKLADSAGSPGSADYDDALNKALAPHMEDLLASIKDIIEIESQNQTEDFKETLSKSFADLYERLPPQDLPTVDDLLANNELLEESQDSEGSVFGRIYASVQEIKADVANLVNKLLHQPGEGKSFEVRAQEFVAQDEVKEALTDSLETKAETAGIKNQSSTLAPGQQVGQQTEGQKLEQQRQAALFDRLESFLDRKEGDNPNASDAEDEKEESKKADTWWQSFARWIGDGAKKKAKKAKTTFTDILKDLGTVGLLASIFDPQMWTQLGKDIETYITWDNLKKSFSTSWDWLKDKTSGIVDWVLTKLGIGGGSKSTAKLTPTAQAQLDQMSPAEQLKAAGGPTIQAAMIAKEEDKDGNLTEKGQTLYNAASPETKKAYQEHKYDNETMVNRVGRGFSDFGQMLTGGKTSRDQQQDAINGTGSGGTTVNTQRTNVANSTTNNSQGPTSVSSGGVNVSPATSTPLPGTTAPDPGAGTNKPPLPMVQGSAPVGLNSFGFTQGTSDHLVIMNTPSILGH